MTTKTIVCSECGAEASGRYACGECGALLAAVGERARSWARDDPPTEPRMRSEDQAEEPGRVPAGSYLAPSAILPPLGAGPVTSAAAAPARPANRARTPTRPSLTAALGRLELTADAPRRALAVGAALATLGFVLPWARVLAGAGLLGDYFTQWGIAGPGHWIVVGLLAGLAGAALADGRLARLPLGTVGIAVAALLVGLVWPYLFGALGRSIGVWTVLIGAIVLGVGGALDVRSRHASGGPVVE